MTGTPTEGGDALTEGKQYGAGLAARLDDDTLRRSVTHHEQRAAWVRERAAYETGVALAMANTLAARQRVAVCPEWDADLCTHPVGHDGDHQDSDGRTWSQDPVIT